MKKFNYQSIFSPFFGEFISMKAGMGNKTLPIEWVLYEFDKFFLERKWNCPKITKDLIEEWRATRINDSQSRLYVKYCILSQFCKFMNRSGYECYIPRLQKIPRSNFAPYIFSEMEMQKIFKVCDQLELYDNHMNTAIFMLPSLIRLLYSTGLRISEALILKNKDVDLQKGCLFVRKSKNGTERIAPLADSLKVILVEYVKYRNRLPVTSIHDSSNPFFVTPNGSSCSQSAIYGWFRKIIKTAEIPHLGKRQGPCIHSLRHSFSVHSLARMDKLGLDLYYSLPLLSTYLGHKSIKSTERYVRLTEEMYPDILNDEKLSGNVFPNIKNK